MAEFYIRREGDEDASGPFDMDQIVSLVEANKLDTDAYYYDIDAEDWLQISANTEMMDTLFPKKKKLSLKGAASESAEVETPTEKSAPEPDQAERKPRIKASEEKESGQDSQVSSEDIPEEADAEDHVPSEAAKKRADEEQAEVDAAEDRRKSRRKPRLHKKQQEEKKKPISVETMLAQAEGRPENDPSGKSPVEKQAYAAMLGMRLATFFVLFSMVAMAYLDLELLKTADVGKIFKSPYTVIAAFDALLGLLLILGVTEIYSLLRFRSAVGAGLLSILFLASGDPLLAVANLLLMASIYLCTILINTSRVLLASIPGLAAVGVYVYLLILPQA